MKPNRNFYVVVSEHDTANWLESDGPLIHETYMRDAGLLEAMERAKTMTRYGRVAIFELQYVGSIENAEKLFMGSEE